MNTHRRSLSVVLLSCLCVVVAAGTVWGRLSEPDHIIYGTATVYGEAVEPGKVVSLTLAGETEPLISYLIGSDETLGGMFALRVPLDAVDERPPGRARTGDPAEIRVDGELAAEVLVGKRGTARFLDVDPENLLALPALIIDDVVLVEGDAGTVVAVFTLSVSPTSEDPITVDWLTEDGTATGGAACGGSVDYVQDSGMVTIPAGDVSGTLSITVCGEEVEEADEDFFVNLVNPTNATLLDPQGKGTIADDDTPPRLSVNNITVPEPLTGDVTGYFRVSLSKVWEADVSFSYATADGTATAGLDYLSASGGGMIPSGALQTTVPVEILADDLNEDDETFILTLTDPVNASVLDGEGQCTIVDAAQFLIWMEIQQDGVSGVDGLAGAYSVAVSPDGEHVYAAGRSEDAVVLFNRDPGTGELSFVTAYVPADFETEESPDFVGLGGVEAVAVSHDGANVYAAAFDDDAVAVFARDAADGTLTLIEVERDGVNDLNDPGGTVDGLDGASALALSPGNVDGEHLYVAGYNDSAVAVFERDLADGSLTFVEVEKDGVDDPSDLGGTVDGLYLASSVAVSADGANVYVAGLGDNAVAAFARDTDPASGTLGRLSFLEVEKDGVGGADGLRAATAVAVAPDGGHVYVAGQSDDALAVFARDGSGNLGWVEVVRNGANGVQGLLGASAVAVSEDSGYVYATGYLSNALAVFSRSTTKTLAAGQLSFVEVKTDGVGGVDGLFGPTAVAVAPGDGNVYVSGRLDNAVAVFARDIQAPTDPTVLTTIPDPSTWTNVPVVQAEWSGASDGGGSGLAGYSFHFDTSPTAAPDTTIDLWHTGDPHATASDPLPDGISHYFHLLTCDHSLNCTATVHAGPFWIDTVPPETPVITDSSHSVGVPNEDPTIWMQWAEPTNDPGTAPSGVVGYSYTFNNNPIGECNLEVDVGLGVGEATSASLPVGAWYFHICAVDAAGNWGAPASAGPYDVIDDSVPPKVINLSSVSAPDGPGSSLGVAHQHGITQLLLTFSKEMFDPPDDVDPADVTNPANYRLVSAGPDTLLQTLSCAATVGDDVLLPIDGVLYESLPKIAAVQVGGEGSIPAGRYRLLACGSTSLEDINGNLLDGNGDGTGGDDFAHSFVMERTSLLLNPNFDDPDLTAEWSLSNSQRISYSFDDADGAGTSGSVVISRLGSQLPEPDPRELAVSQCVNLPAWDGSPYHLSGSVRVNETLGGDPGSAGAVGEVRFFDAPSCAGGDLGTAETNVVLDNTGGAWMPLTADLGLADPAAQSAQVSFKVAIPADEDFGFDAWFDSLLFQQSDGAPPVDPVVESMSHVAGTFTNLPVVQVTWYGAADAGVGVAGYSFLFDNIPDTLPDTILDMAHGEDPHETTSEILVDGDWYFHLRTCDHAGNCTSTVHLGPFSIDTLPPDNPTDVQSTTHAVGVPDLDSVIEMSWTPAIDNGASGVAGYAYAFDLDPVGACDLSADLGAGATGVSSDPLASGSYYFHICTVDGASNWSGLLTVGPYVIEDDLPPTVTQVGTVNAISGGSLDEGESTDASITQLIATFSKPVADPAGDFELDDVTNPANYRVVSGGADGLVETTTCGALQGDDQAVSIDSVLYDGGSWRAAVRIDGDAALPEGPFRLIACGSTSIVDLDGMPLDGNGDGTGGDDFVRSFEVLGTNLLLNPNLDVGLDHWTPTVTAPSAFVLGAEDADGATTSGSAFITNVSGPDAVFELAQCVDISGFGGPFGLDGRVYIDQVGAGVPDAWAVAEFYDGAACSGSLVGSSQTGLVSGDTADAWVRLGPLAIDAPVGAVSVMVRFVVVADSDPSADFGAGFDNLGFRDGAMMLVFGDGFESGDVGSWSGGSP